MLIHQLINFFVDMYMLDMNGNINEAFHKWLEIVIMWTCGADFCLMKTLKK